MPYKDISACNTVFVYGTEHFSIQSIEYPEFSPVGNTVNAYPLSPSKIGLKNALISHGPKTVAPKHNDPRQCLPSY